MATGPTSLLVVQLSAQDKRKIRQAALDNDTSLKAMVKHWIDSLPTRTAMIGDNGNGTETRVGPGAS